MSLVDYQVYDLPVLDIGCLHDNGAAAEVKWDGFRAIVSTEDDLRVRSRRGWDIGALGRRSRS
jgi:ATP-dependent DNA ligase